MIHVMGLISVRSKSKLQSNLTSTLFTGCRIFAYFLPLSQQNPQGGPQTVTRLRCTSGPSKTMDDVHGKTMVMELVRLDSSFVPVVPRMSLAVTW